MCFRNLFKRKETAESIFAARATQSITLAETMMANLGPVDRVAIKDILRQIEDEVDKFTDIPQSEVDKIFDNLNVILLEIQSVATGKASFANGKMSVHTLENSIKSFIDILKFYVLNNVKKGSFRLKDGEIKDILKAATAIAAIEEIEIRAKNAEQAIRDREDEAKKLDTQIASLEDRMKNEPGLSNFDLDRLEREIDRLDERLDIVNEQIENNTAIYDDCQTELKNISHYQMMLERFLAGETLRNDSHIGSVYKDMPGLAGDLTARDIEKKLRDAKAQGDYESTRVKKEKKKDGRSAKARAEREQVQRSRETMEQDKRNFGEDNEQKSIRH